MKSKKILLGALMALAVSLSAFNLFGQTRTWCAWRIVNCVCIWDEHPQFKNFTYYCDLDSCLEVLDGCNPN